MSIETQEPGSRPSISSTDAVKLAKELFGLSVVQEETVKELDSYKDVTFYMKGILNNSHYSSNSDEEFVLKVINYIDSVEKGLIEAQDDAMVLVQGSGLLTQVPIKSINGEYIVYKNLHEGEDCRTEESRRNAARLLRYIPGEVLSSLPQRHLSPSFLYDLGKHAGKIDKSLKDYECQILEAHALLRWDLQQLESLVPYISVKYLGTTDRVKLIRQVYDKFISVVLPTLKEIKKHVIHNDINHDNIIIVSYSESIGVPEGKGDRRGAISVIDFGDISYTYRVFEVSICMTYMILMSYVCEDPDSIQNAGYVLLGYQDEYPLSEKELQLVYWCVAARMSQSLACGSHEMTVDPDRSYLNGEEKHFWEILPIYLKISPDRLLESWLTAKL